ncbi:MAG: Hsp20/alpha crystallin family protein [bacterium]|nr:Hsp20/alpha crystallin family protein [bacterium]MDE0352581.1 Hsp20/alpha crystallin family protein [bacterium]
MQLVRTRPFKFVPDIDSLFDGLPLAGTHLLGARDRLGAPTLVPRVDIIESGAEITARFEIPGFELADLEVTVEDNVLTVKGSRSYDLADGATYRHRELADGGFSRSITLADNVDSDQVTARLANGILDVVVRKQPDVLPRTIEIEAA